jgi:radical SAM superfamily enzyme YgiQ (UPF0313 family)
VRILLIDIVRTAIGDVWPAVEPSIGLMYVAAYLRRHLGDRVDVRITTLVSRAGCEEEERQQALAWLATHAPQVVGIRCLSIGKDALYALARTVKQWDAHCPVLVGGPHASDDPEEVLREAPVDAVAVGEGEVTALELVTRLLEGRSLDGVAGTVRRDGDAVVRAERRELIEDLDALPLPEWSLVDDRMFTNRYLTFSSRAYRPHGNVLTTRGCPFRCMYCHNILGKRFRARSPQSVIDEFRWLHDEYGFTDFQILDDIFNLDRRRALAICDGIKGLGTPFTLSFPNGLRGDVIDEEVIDALAAAGTRFVSYAIETASPRLQKLIRKNLDLGKVFRAIEHTAKAGIITRGFFMLGFPTETEEEVLQTVEFAKSSALTGAAFFSVVYFPGTELYRLAREMGYFRDEDAEVRRDYVQVGRGPYDFPVERLVEIKRTAIREFAFTRARIENALRMLPAYFSPREIDGFLMMYVVSSGLSECDIEDEWVRRTLHRQFVVAERFSAKGRFYV